MVIAALPFAFHYGIFSREIKAKKLGSEIVVYGIIIFLAIIIYTSIEYPFLYSVKLDSNTTISDNLSQGGKGDEEKGPATLWILSAFLVVSASTTTGFQFVDLSHLSVEGKTVLIVIMLIGGTAFSTAGGIKIARLLIIFKSLRKRKPSAIADTPTSISSYPSQFQREKDVINVKRKKQGG